MRNFRKNISEQINKLNGKYGLLIKIYLIISIIVFSVLIIAVIVNFSYNLYLQYNEPVFFATIKNIETLDYVLKFLKEENIKFTILSNGSLIVENKNAKKMRSLILFNENLLFANLNPWKIYDNYWYWINITDFERNVNIQQARQNIIIDHIKTIDGINDAWITIAWSTENNPNASVSLIIEPKLDSDFNDNQLQFEIILEYLVNSIEGLQAENIVITNQEGYLIL